MLGMFALIWLGLPCWPSGNVLHNLLCIRSVIYKPHGQSLGQLTAAANPQCVTRQLAIQCCLVPCPTGLCLCGQVLQATHHQVPSLEGPSPHQEHPQAATHHHSSTTGCHPVSRRTRLAHKQ